MIETKFKNSEVGLIPEDWKAVPLSAIGEVKMCKRILKEQTDITGDVPFYKIGTFGKEADAYIPRELYEQFKGMYPYPKKGAILISAAGTIGRTVVFDGEDAYFQDSNIVWIDHKEKDVVNPYLEHYFKIISWKSENGGTISRLYNDNLKSTFLCYPEDKIEQSRIATALSNIDDLIATTRKLTEKKRNIKEGAMQDLLSGKRRIKGYGIHKSNKKTPIGVIPEDWSVSPLEKLCSLKARIGWQGLTTGEYLDQGDYILITGTDFKDGYINWETCSYVSKWRYDQDPYIQIKVGDVLISKDGTIGKVAYLNSIPMEGTLNSGVFVVRPKNEKVLTKHYLSWLFKSVWFNTFIDQLSGGSTINHLFQKDFEKFLLVYPSDINEQSAISNALSDMDSEISSLESRLIKYQSLKQGMMQQLLTGKIRLI